jgi:hypothetical protein
MRRSPTQMGVGKNGQLPERRGTVLTMHEPWDSRETAAGSQRR